MVAHLGEREREKILEVFLQHETLFSDRLSIASVREYDIVLQEGFVPKGPHPYRVPASMKGEVGKQVDELLELGLIFPCESP